MSRERRWWDGPSLFGVMLTAAVLAARANIHNYKNTTKVLNKLFNKDRYDKRLRPFHREKVLNITMQATVVSFGSINEINMEYSLDMFFRQSWKDPRLQHDVYPSILLPGEGRKGLWLPDTFFFNVKEAKYHNVPADNSRIEITPDGRVVYSARITLTSSCRMNFENFPLDGQNCSWEVLSYSYTNDEVDYFWNPLSSLIILDAEMAEFFLEDFRAQRMVHKYVSGSYTHLVASFLFQRRLAYSFIQIYAPTFLIVSLAYLSFWISRGAVPARVALGITTVLTLVTLMGSLRNTVPKVSYIKAIDWYLIVAFGFVFGVLVEYVFVLSDRGPQKRMALKEEIEKKQKLLSNDHSPEEQVEDVEKGRAAEVKRPRSRLERGKGFLHRIFIPTIDNDMEVSIYDKFSRVLYPIAFLAFNAMYWSIYG